MPSCVCAPCGVLSRDPPPHATRYLAIVRIFKTDAQLDSWPTCQEQFYRVWDVSYLFTMWIQASAILMALSGVQLLKYMRFHDGLRVYILLFQARARWLLVVSSRADVYQYIYIYIYIYI